MKKVKSLIYKTTMKKKREYNSSELVQTFIKIYKLEEKILIFPISEFLEEYLGREMFSEIKYISLNKGILDIKINSPLLKNDLRMRKTFFMKKFSDIIGEKNISDIRIL